MRRRSRRRFAQRRRMSAFISPRYQRSQRHNRPRITPGRSTSMARCPSPGRSPGTRHNASCFSCRVPTPTARPSTAGLTLDETAPLAPMNVYAETKAAADFVLGGMAAQGLRVVRLRPFNHTGPGQSAQFVVGAFALQIARIALVYRSLRCRSATWRLGVTFSMCVTCAMPTSRAFIIEMK